MQKQISSTCILINCRKHEWDYERGLSRLENRHDEQLVNICESKILERYVVPS